jgi:hypothetical protein
VGAIVLAPHGMVGDEGPGVERGFTFQDECSKAGKGIGAIGVIAEDLAAFDAARDDVVEDAWCVQTRCTGHGAWGS